MANIVVPNLPANLPTDWTLDQTITPNGTEVWLGQEYGYNYLMEQVNSAQNALITLAAQALQDVEGLGKGLFNADASRADGVVAITGPEDANMITFVAPADWVDGDTYTYNGTTLILTNLNNQQVQSGWQQGAPIVFYLLGSRAYFYPTGSGGFIEMTENIPVINRQDNTLYSLVLADFGAQEVNN